MKINAINCTNFQSKKQFIFDNNLDDLHKLLQMMNKNVKINEDEFSTTSSIVKELNMPKIVKFTDNRDLTKPLLKDFSWDGFSSMFFKEVSLDINNKTGEIINCERNCNIKNDTILMKINTYLKLLIKNYDNDKLVKKNLSIISEISETGISALSKIVEKYKV